MARRPFLGMHRGEYEGALRESRGYQVLNEANIQRLHENFQDIAALDKPIAGSGEHVWLQCYPGREAAGPSESRINSPRYRKWGSYQSGFALILPLAIKSGSSGCMIRSFQIDTILKDSRWLRRQTILADSADDDRGLNARQLMYIPSSFLGFPRFTRPFTTDGCVQVLSLRKGLRKSDDIQIFAEMMDEQLYDDPPTVSLLDMPHPQKLEKLYNTEGWFRSGKWWRFESRALPGPIPGRLQGARMVWTGSRHDPHLLHCALAIEHAQEPFGITCQVSGQAYAGLYTYAFDNFVGTEHRIWQLQPQPADGDLEVYIANLADQMYELNKLEMDRATLGESGLSRAASSPYPAHGGRDLAVPRGHTYPAIVVNGPAHLGDTMYDSAY